MQFAQLILFSDDPAAVRIGEIKPDPFPNLTPNTRMTTMKWSTFGSLMAWIVSIGLSIGALALSTVALSRTAQTPTSTPNSSLSRAELRSLIEDVVRAENRAAEDRFNEMAAANERDRKAQDALQRRQTALALAALDPWDRARVHKLVQSFRTEPDRLNQGQLLAIKPMVSLGEGEMIDEILAHRADIEMFVAAHRGQPEEEAAKAP